MLGEPLQVLLWFVKYAPQSLVPFKIKHHQLGTKHSKYKHLGGALPFTPPHMVTQAGKGRVGVEKMLNGFKGASRQEEGFRMPMPQASERTMAAIVNSSHFPG